MNNESTRALWEAFLKLHPDVNPAIPPQVQTFGVQGCPSTTILDGLLKGKASGWIEPLLAVQGREGSLPVIGGFFVLLDSQGHARAIAQIKTARLHPFFNVPQECIASEGSGLKSLEAWKKAVWDNFANQLMIFGKSLRESSIMVCTTVNIVFTGK